MNNDALNQIYNTGMSYLDQVQTEKANVPQAPAQTSVVTQVEQQIQEPVAPVEQQVQEPTTVQPTAGTTGSSTHMSVNIDGIRENKRLIEEAANDLASKWAIIDVDVQHIDEAWAGKEAQMYKDKIKVMDNKIKKVIDALQIIANTYQKAIDEIEGNQNTIKNDLL